LQRSSERILHPFNAFGHHRPDRVKNKQRSGGVTQQSKTSHWSRIMSITLKKSGMLKLRLSLVAMTVAASVQAKTLVYCSEGSPEGFNPQLFTSGTTYDASSVPIYNRLVEFKTGTTEVIPGLAEKWDVSEDGKTYTFHLRQGVK